MLPTVIILKLAFVGGAVIPLFFLLGDKLELSKNPRSDVWSQI